MLETKERQAPGGSSTKDPALHRFYTWSGSTRQFLRYSLVGGANTLVDVLVLNALLWCFPTNKVLVLVAYNSVAYGSGAVTSFFLNKYWTFGRKQRTTGREVVRFAIILVLEILYSNGLIWLIGKALQPVIANPTLWGNASKLVAVAGGAVLSYAFMRFWIFARGSQNQPNKREPLQQKAPEAALMATSHTADTGQKRGEKQHEYFI